MNKKQLISLWVGIIIIVVMSLFPPWVVNLKDYQINCGYDWIGTPPIYTWSSSEKIFRLPNGPRPQDEYITKKHIVSKHIDISRLCFQWAIVGIITSGLLVTFKRYPEKDT